MDLPLSDFEENGCAFFDNAISKDSCAAFNAALEGFDIGAGSRGNDLPDSVADLINSSNKLQDIAAALIGQNAKPVRIILFDKTEIKNWGVPWHQDKTIAVQEKFDVEGYGPWTRKGDIPHVEPPVDILTSMVTLRIHLDDCGPNDGPLIIIKGGHKQGKQRQASIVTLANALKDTPIFAARGDVFAMRPLLPHQSRAAQSPKNRRVLHVEYSSGDLTAPLEWYGVS